MVGVKIFSDDAVVYATKKVHGGILSTAIPHTAGRPEWGLIPGLVSVELLDLDGSPVRGGEFQVDPGLTAEDAAIEALERAEALWCE